MYLVINFLSLCLFSTSTRLLLVSTMEVTCTKPHCVKVSSCNSSASSHFQSLDFQECLHHPTTRAVQFLLEHVYSFTCQLALSYHLIVIRVTQLVPLFFFGSNVGCFFRYQRCCSKKKQKNKKKDAARKFDMASSSFSVFYSALFGCLFFCSTQYRKEAG